jgi:hypothetical protein
VGLRLVDVGNVVTASSTAGIVVITQLDPIAVVFTLPEDALRLVLPRIQSGAKLPVDAFERSRPLLPAKPVRCGSAPDACSRRCKPRRQFSERPRWERNAFG